MSINSHSRDSRNKFSTEKSVKKFCGVCQKAGLSEKEYTSHFTKSVPGPTGTVICPTILNNECSFCFKLGHFKSACPAIAERNRIQNNNLFEGKRQQERATIPKNVQKNVQKKTVSFNRGGFGILEDYSDDEEPISKKRSFTTANEKKEEWPTLSTVAAKPILNKPSFASIAANPIPVKKIEPLRPNICGFSILTKNGIQHPPKAPMKYCSWADDSDSDIEDIDEVYEDTSAW